MTRLYYQVYLTIFGSLALLAAGVFWQAGKSERERVFDALQELAATALPLTSSSSRLQQALDEFHAKMGYEVALYSCGRQPIATAGRSLASPPADLASAGRFQQPREPVLSIRLQDGRWIVLPSLSPPSMAWIRFRLLAGWALVIAICCYPVVRYLARRLERLQAGVDSLGTGDLKARVKVEGHDEVARLAQSFNSAVAQIELLVGAHKLLLANVSHELRTPLSRLRLTAELLKEVADPKRKADLEKDITEIDALIEQVLLSSRLDAVGELEVREEVDLLALAAEEGARCAESDITGEPVVVRGDPTLLRRMIRNLIENAQQHGAPPVEIRVRREGARAILSISDQGPGIAPGEQDRVFMPFYRPRGTRSRGSGLGLALVRQIARQHGGEAVAAGSPTCPSTIEVSIPAEDSNAILSYA